MRITDVRPVTLEIPLERPLRTSIHDIRSVCAVAVTIETDAGIAGEGYLFTLGPDKIRVLLEMIMSLAKHIIDKDPTYTEKIWADLWSNINFYGHKGITIFAISVFITC